MPPPSSYRKSAIATTKPNLPVKGWRDIYNPKRGKTPLEQYEGPQAFVFPGNHDWFDGLATYARLVLSRDWLGGWLMPQERSYFAICLPKGWWLLGVDLALAEDIDLEQFRFFALLATVPSVVIACHRFCSLKFQTGFTRGLCQRLYSAMENVTTAIKYNCIYALCFCAFCNQFTNYTCRSNIGGFTRF